MRWNTVLFDLDGTVDVYKRQSLGFAMWRTQTSIRETNLLSPACVVPM